MKYAVVTGGTSGIGLGVAKMLIEKGYYVYATYTGFDFSEKLDTKFFQNSPKTVL